MVEGMVEMLVLDNTCIECDQQITLCLKSSRGPKSIYDGSHLKTCSKYEGDI